MNKIKLKINYWKVMSYRLIVDNSWRKQRNFVSTSGGLRFRYGTSDATSSGLNFLPLPRYRHTSFAITIARRMRIHFWMTRRGQTNRRIRAQIQIFQNITFLSENKTKKDILYIFRIYVSVKFILRYILKKNVLFFIWKLIRKRTENCLNGTKLWYNRINK